jgi:hypothetical protein
MDRMRVTTCLVAVLAADLIAQASGAFAGQSGAANGATPAIVERFLSGTGPPMTSYRALRTLEAETRGGQMRATITAWTSLDPVSGFEYSIVDENGSGTIRQRVLRPALEAERSMRAGGEIARGALDPSNYQFTEARGAADGLVQIGIHPKRHDTLLLEGNILLTEPDCDLVRVEGFLVKRPSFWTRRVEVVRRYARIRGVRVPVTMESTAQVLLMGQSTFSMTYEYESINGEPVGRPGGALAR